MLILYYTVFTSLHAVHSVPTNTCMHSVIMVHFFYSTVFRLPCIWFHSFSFTSVNAFAQQITCRLQLFKWYVLFFLFCLCTGGRLTFARGMPERTYRCSVSTLGIWCISSGYRRGEQCSTICDTPLPPQFIDCDSQGAVYPSCVLIHEHIRATCLLGKV